MSEQTNEPVIQGRLAWPNDHTLMRQSSLINQMAATVVQTPDGDPECIAVTLGFAMQPQFAGTPEQQLEAALAAVRSDPDGYLRVPIEPVARFLVSRGQAERLRVMLDDIIARYDALEQTHEA
ncbi:MAG: hypothetical protein AB7I38_14510 [Dehalococcoidia bacterium]